MDEAGSVISYEEYHPYGTTAYRSGRSGVEVSAKRYRYTGKERDEETGLYYHGARYYASWLGRWTAADPAGMVDGANLYAYVRGSPVGLVDPSGRESIRLPEDTIYGQRPSVSAYEERAAAGQSEGIDQIARLVGDKVQTAPSGGDATSAPSAQAESTRPQTPPRSESVSGQPPPITPEGRHLQVATIGVGESFQTGGSGAVVGQIVYNWLQGVSPNASDAKALARAVANSGLTALARRSAYDAPGPMRARPVVKGEPVAKSAQGGATKAAPSEVATTAAARGRGKAIQPYWPPNRGFLHPPKPITLPTGTKIDRFGAEGGTFASPQGTPFEARGLPPEQVDAPYNRYEVLKPLAAQGGQAAPAFGQLGLGLQYEFSASISELIKQGFLRRIVHEQK